MNICYVRGERKRERDRGEKNWRWSRRKERVEENEKKQTEKKKKNARDLTMVVEGWAKKDDDTSRTWKKNASEQASKQIKRKTREQRQKHTHSSESVKDSFFFSFSPSLSACFAVSLLFFFLVPTYTHAHAHIHTHYICESNCPSLKILGQHFSLFSYWRKTYVTQIIRTHIHIIRKQRSRGTRGERIHVRNTDGYSRRLLSLTNASTHLPISNSIRYVNALEKKETFSSLV